jgi:hypothetical protein
VPPAGFDPPRAVADRQALQCPYVDLQRVIRGRARLPELIRGIAIGDGGIWAWRKNFCTL